MSKRREPDTRGRILAAAEQVMRERGLGRATTKEIARAAGVSEGTLYNHFTNKEEIFLCVLRDRLPRFIRFMMAFPGYAGRATVRENLEELARVALPFYRQSVPLGASVYGEPLRLARLREETRRHHAGPQKANELATAYLRAEQERGRLPATANAAAAADLLLGACFQQAYLVPFFVVEPSPESDAAYAQTLVTTLLAGLLSSGQAEPETDSLDQG